MSDKTQDACSVETTEQLTKIMTNQYDTNNLPYIDMTETMEVMLTKLTDSNEELLQKSMVAMGKKCIELTKSLLVDHADNRPIVDPGTQNDDASATKEVTPLSNVSLNAEESAGNSHRHRDDDIISLAPTIASRCFGAGFETSSTITRRSQTPIGEEEMQADRRPSVHSAH